MNFHCAGEGDRISSRLAFKIFSTSYEILEKRFSISKLGIFVIDESSCTVHWFTEDINEANASMKQVGVMGKKFAKLV